MLTINAVLACTAILYMGMLVHNRKLRPKSSWLLESGGQDPINGAAPVVETRFINEGSFADGASFDHEVTNRDPNRFEPNFYRVLIVRAWKEQSEHSETETPRFVLEIPATAERYGFVSIEAMQTALNTILSTTP